MNKHVMPPEDLLAPEASTPQNPGLQAEVPITSPSTQKPIKKANRSLILGILTVFIATSALLGYILYLQLTGTKNLITAQNLASLIKLSTSKSTPYPGRSPSPSPTNNTIWEFVVHQSYSFEVPTDWQTFNDERNKIAFKYPPNWHLNMIDEKYGDSSLYLDDHDFSIPEGIEFTTPLMMSFNKYPTNRYRIKEDDGLYFEKTIEETLTRYKIMSYDKPVTIVKEFDLNGSKAMQMFGESGPGMFHNQYFKHTFIQLGDKVLIFDLRNKNSERIYDQILSTFKFTTPANSQETGARLQDIKYTLPENWEAKLDSEKLMLSPKTGGGYLSITVKIHNKTADIKEYFCQIDKVCTESTNFTNTIMGNITGYKADSLDNSGGGPMYFGAKGDKFYTINSYTPPSPNEFETSYSRVLSSLIF